jgi:hypothetical protein
MHRILGQLHAVHAVGGVGGHTEKQGGGGGGWEVEGVVMKGSTQQCRPWQFLTTHALHTPACTGLPANHVGGVNELHVDLHLPLLEERLNPLHKEGS